LPGHLIIVPGDREVQPFWWPVPFVPPADACKLLELEPEAEAVIAIALDATEELEVDQDASRTLRVRADAEREVDVPQDRDVLLETLDPAALADAMMDVDPNASVLLSAKEDGVVTIDVDPEAYRALTQKEDAEQSIEVGRQPHVNLEIDLCEE
jgi:hypothetical protein